MQRLWNRPSWVTVVHVNPIFTTCAVRNIKTPVTKWWHSHLAETPARCSAPTQTGPPTRSCSCQNVKWTSLNQGPCCVRPWRYGLCPWKLLQIVSGNVLQFWQTRQKHAERGQPGSKPGLLPSIASARKTHYLQKFSWKFKHYNLEPQDLNLRITTSKLH